MIGLTEAQIEKAWSNNAKMRTNFNGNFAAYKRWMDGPSAVLIPASTATALSNGAHGRHLPASREADNEEKPMTQPNNTAAGEAALAQIKIWQEEDRQKAAMARMAITNPEQAWRAEFAASTALQKEFRSIETWVAYKKGQAKGLCR